MRLMQILFNLFGWHFYRHIKSLKNISYNTNNYLFINQVSAFILILWWVDLQKFSNFYLEGLDTTPSDGSDFWVTFHAFLS